MIVKDDLTTTYFCDSCAEEMEYESEFTVTIDYGGEDSCYGCRDGENELLDHNEENYDAVHEYLTQEKFIWCEDCRNGNSETVTEFEDGFRRDRVKVVQKLIDNKSLPEFSDQVEEAKKQLKHWVAREAEAIDKLKGKLADFGYISAARELVHAQQMQHKYEQVIHG